MGNQTSGNSSTLKQSANIALNSSNDYNYGNEKQIKNSLQLLKAKRNNRRSYDYDKNPKSYEDYQSNAYNPEVYDEKTNKNVRQKVSTYDYNNVLKNNLPKVHNEKQVPKGRQFQQQDKKQIYHNDYRLKKYSQQIETHNRPKRTSEYKYYQPDINSKPNRMSANSQQKYKPKPIIGDYAYENKKASKHQNDYNNKSYENDYIANKYNANKNVNEDSVIKGRRNRNIHEFQRQAETQQSSNYQKSSDKRSYPVKQADNKYKLPNSQRYQDPNKYSKQKQFQYPIQSIEDKPIRQVNRENRIDIVEYNPNEFIQCRLCGRSFNPDSVGRHEKICKKVFINKRKQFNIQQHRIVQENQKKLMKQGQRIQAKIQQKKNNQKMPKWKMQSLAFRAVIKQNKNQQLTGQEQALQRKLAVAQNYDKLQCPYCGRKFNQQAGQRHINFCKEQSKKAPAKKR